MRVKYQNFLIIMENTAVTNELSELSVSDFNRLICFQIQEHIIAIKLHEQIFTIFRKQNHISIVNLFYDMPEQNRFHFRHPETVSYQQANRQ